MVQVLQVEARSEFNASVQIFVPSRSKRLEDVLVFHLLVEGRVLVDFLAILRAHQISDALLNLADLLGLGKTVVEHLLIVAHESHLAFEARSPVVLRLREAIMPLFEGGAMGSSSLGIVVDLRIVPQSVVEGALVESRLMYCAETARVGRDIAVATAAVVHVNHGPRVKSRQIVGRALLLYDERS